MKRVKLYESWLAEKTMTSDEIIQYVKSLTPSDSDHPDYFLAQIKKSGKDFELKTVNIKDVLKKDKDVKDYVMSGEERYGKDSETDYEPSYSEIEHPIVIFNNEVIDGYSRTSTLYHQGETKIQAWISI